MKKVIEHANDAILQLFHSLGIIGMDAFHEQVPKSGLSGPMTGERGVLSTALFKLIKR